MLKKRISYNCYEARKGSVIGILTRKAKKIFVLKTRIKLHVSISECSKENQVYISDHFYSRIETKFFFTNYKYFYKTVLKISSIWHVFESSLYPFTFNPKLNYNFRATIINWNLLKLLLSYFVHIHIND